MLLYVFISSVGQIVVFGLSMGSVRPMVRRTEVTDVVATAESRFP